MTVTHAMRALSGIATREMLRFLQQRERFLAALVRPLLWLLVFAAGFRAVLGLSIAPPYETYVIYEVYVVPGLVGMVLLFNGMQSSLSMVYDREMGSMRMLLTSPLPRWFVLGAKLIAGASVSVLQAYCFLAAAAIYGVRFQPTGYIAILPAMFLAAFSFGAIGLLLSSLIRQLENFAGVMNFVIFPLFFLSTALYPLWKMQESSELLYWLCLWNPFSHAVELIRFAAYVKFNGLALAVTAGAAGIFLLLAIWSYDPRFGLLKRQVA